MMFTSGCPFADVPTGLYKAWAVPLILRTAAQPASRLVPAGDARELKFTGAGVECLADKGPGLGTAEILLDGRKVRTVSFDLPDFPRLRDVVVYRTAGLPRGPHSIRVVSRSAAPIALAGFRVW